MTKRENFIANYVWQALIVITLVQSIVIIVNLENIRSKDYRNVFYALLVTLVPVLLKLRNYAKENVIVEDMEKMDKLPDIVLAVVIPVRIV